MTVISEYEAMVHLPKWIERAKAGEEIVVAPYGEKIGVRLVPVPVEVELPPLQEREGGQWEGKVWIAPDFDEWPEDMAKALGMTPP